MQALPQSMVIGYIKVDARSLKQALVTWVSKWTFLYTQHLQTSVSCQALKKDSAPLQRALC